MTVFSHVADTDALVRVGAQISSAVITWAIFLR